MKIDMMNMMWMCAMLICMTVSNYFTTEAEGTMSEKHKQPALSRDVYEQHKRSLDSVEYIAEFKNGTGARRVEAAMGLKWLLERSLSFQEVEELLGTPDEQQTKYLWRYHLREKQWMEVAFNTQQEVLQVTLLFDDVSAQNHVAEGRSHSQEVRLYIGMSTEEILRAWRHPHRKQDEEHNGGALWYYQFNDEGIWELFVQQHVLKGICYVTVPNMASSSTKGSSPMTQDDGQHISDLEQAVVVFKTTVIERGKAAALLVPLIQQGVTTQQEVEALLGVPTRISDDGRFYIYSLGFSGERVSISFNKYRLVETIYSFPDDISDIAR